MTDQSPNLYTNVFKRGNRLMVRSINQETGERIKETIDYKPFLYLETNRPEKAVAKGLRDETLERIDFATINEFDDFQDRYKDAEGFKMFGCRDTVYQYIASMYPGKIKHKFEHIRGNILDIEVESGDITVVDGKIVDINPGPFPEPADANYPVTAVTIYDTKTKTFFTLGLETFKGVHLGTYQHDSTCPKIGGCRVIYRGYHEEHQLLAAMMNLISNMEPDFVSGWNSDTFDVVYIINRVKKVLGDDWAKKISPWGFIRQRTFTGSFGRDEVAYDTYGLAQLDYKALVEKHGYVELANKKLNTAAEHYLKEGKISMDEAKTLNKLYFTNYPKYIKYNIQDVNLIVRMEAKLKFFELVFVLAYMCHCNPEDTMGTVQPWSAMLYAKLHNRGQEPELKPVFGGDVNFVGAYVQEPRPGKYRWGVSIDANALYPHMDMQFNMGPETILDKKDSYKVRMMMVAELDKEVPTAYIRRLKESIRHGDSIHEFYWEQPYVFKTLKELGLTMAPNCSFYRKDRKSILSETFEELYAERKIVKKSMLKHEQELVDLTSQEGWDVALENALENLISSEHNTQWGIKIVANGGYGALANRWLREYFMIEIAEGITTAGQVGLRYEMKCMNEYLNSLCGTKDYNFIITGDTDSIYVCLDPLIQLKCAGYTESEVVQFIDDLFKNDIEPKLIQWAEVLADALNCYSNKLFFKREKIFTVGTFTAKKRYAMMVADSEGVRFSKPELKFTGLEAKKSDYPAFCRAWLKECYYIALNQTEKEIHQKVKSVKVEFMSKQIHEIAAPKSVNNIEKYLLDAKTGSVEKGTPAQVKAAVNYNAMLIQTKYQGKPIVSGEKLLYVPLKKGAPRGMEIIGFPEFLPEEFGLHNWVDKQESFNKFFISPLNNFLKAMNWSPEPRASVMGFFQ